MKTIAKLIYKNNSTLDFDRENTLKKLWNEQVAAANISGIYEPRREQQQPLTLPTPIGVTRRRGPNQNLNQGHRNPRFSRKRS
ncbi:hypothetical protein BH18THE2_BH18THE2_40560 [soil metagenome]